ncbi:MAG: hypothetical protein H0V97_07010 [Actinobacteria bacterium]|nr:hypothetical protein [Actinomycetota bacterium]
MNFDDGSGRFTFDDSYEIEQIDQVDRGSSPDGEGVVRAEDVDVGDRAEAGTLA